MDRLRNPRVPSSFCVLCEKRAGIDFRRQSTKSPCKPRLEEPLRVFVPSRSTRPMVPVQASFLSGDTVGAGLISLGRFLQPGDDVRVEAHADGRHPDRPADGRMRPSLREHRGKRKQIPPLRRRMRSGSGRNERNNGWEYFHSGKTRGRTVRSRNHVDVTHRKTSLKLSFNGAPSRFEKVRARGEFGGRFFGRRPFFGRASFDRALSGQNLGATLKGAGAKSWSRT